MILIGINWEQNSSASIFINGKLLGAISEERFSRVKNDERYPKNAINYLLKKNKIKKVQVNKVVFVSKDWAPSWILCRHYSSFSIKDYIKEQNLIWWPKIYEKKEVSPLEVFSNKLDLDQYPGKAFWKNTILKYEGTMAHPSQKNLSELGRKVRRIVVKKHLGDSVKIYFSDHSDSHTSYAYFSQENRNEKFLSISLDAFGDGINYSAKTFYNHNGKIKNKTLVKGNDLIIGRLYRYITLIMGLKPNEHEYKVMGLAPYCKEKYYRPLLNKFKKLQDVDGLNFKYLNKPKDHYFQIRDMLIGERFDTIAGALQAYTEYLILKWVKNLLKETNIKNICIAGGIAMNVKANMKISKIKSLENFHIPLCPDDTSQSIGCVYQYLNNTNLLKKKIYPMTSPYLGYEISNSQNKTKNMRHIINKFLKNFNRYEDYKIISDNHVEAAVDLLSKNKVIGIMQGKEEFGARALGNRSILANPENVNIKFKINEKIKDRDFWMPFAASVLESHAESYLKLYSKKESYKYMTNTCSSTKIGIEKIPAGLHPHDLTCRPHVIERGSNLFYESLIKRFGDKTGTYALLNTSLNLHGLPICSNEIDALEVLVKSDLDGLLFENILVVKNNINF